VTRFCSTHRTPRAGVDRIDCAGSALAVIELAIHRPLVAETIVLVLDPEHRGRTIVVVDGTERPDSVVEICERLALAASLAGTGDQFGGALVVATVRPGSGPLPGDDDRWLEASDVVEQAGVELLEWFVVAPGSTACPRDLLAEPPRWRR
jgi:hypothetical protein